MLQIARKYKVPAELIVSWNNLPPNYKLKAGQQLSLYVDQEKITTNTIIASTTSIKPQNDTMVILATKTKRTPTDGVKEIVTVNNSQQKKIPVSPTSNWYKVQDGDTIWTIAKEFNLSPVQLKQWNQLQSNVIHPGNSSK